MLVPKINPKIWAVKRHEATESDWLAKKIILICRHDPVIGVYIKTLLDNADALAAAVLTYDLINTQMEINVMEK